jgi:hypothetical protein
MANAETNLIRFPVGKEGREIHNRVAASTHIYEGTLISQLNSGLGMVPATTASSGAVVAVATHEADNSDGDLGDMKIVLETDRVFIFPNKSSGGCDDDTLVGALVYCDDDHTIKETGTVAAGYFMGMEPDGRVRVYVTPFTAVAALGLVDLT